MKHLLKLVIFLTIPAVSARNALAQADQAARESKYYRISPVPIPDSIPLEVGGLAFNDRGQLAVATRHGKIWLIDHPASAHPAYRLFASGLHEALGLAFRDGAYYTCQRGELTRITDTDGDGEADRFETVYAWPLSGNYHEYSYGPLLLPDGSMIVTLNLGWTTHMESLAKWRGWMLKISPSGKMEPYATGMRSPAGFGLNAAGDLFYAENQGDWIGSGWITQVEKGDFTGHPQGLKWADEPGSPIHHLRFPMFKDSMGTMYEFAKSHPELKLPSVWFPQGIMGTSTSGLINIDPQDFGPFSGQLLVGDEGQSKIMRVFLEKVNGAYQGACFPFREGFSSGVLRLLWGAGPALYVGMTSRGWPSVGGKPYGLARLTWTGRVPFEMEAIRAKPYGFELTFTKPVDRKTASSAAAYAVTGFTYLYHAHYGSPIVDKQVCPVTHVMVSADGKRVELHVQGLRPGYIHEIRLQGVLARGGEKPLHDFAYYTLNAIPGGGAGEAAGTASATSGTTGCGADPVKNVTARPAAWSGGPDDIIALTTRPGLKFDKASFTVKAGERVQLSFTNADDMLHNVVIARPGSLDAVGKAALTMGIDGPDLGYVPRSDAVLFNTCLLQPGASQSLYFTAPEKPGSYPYLCTYPGHYLKMNGIMHVTAR